jgi:protein-disulfide isomerase
MVIVAAGCAVVLTIVALRRPAGVATPGGPTYLVPRKIDGWDAVVTGVRHWLGDSSAPIRLVVFSDFECPYCKRFAEETAPGLLGKYPRQLAIGFRHWPLERHRHAMKSARVAECATGSGLFWQVHDRLFVEQDSLETAPQRILEQLPTADAERIRKCLVEADETRIDEDMAAALRVGHRGTPVVILQGTLYPIADQRVLDAAIADLIAEDG